MQVDDEAAEVVARHTAPNCPAYTDSCVEIFISSAGSQLPYVNLEMNCLGAILLQTHATAPRGGGPVDPAIWHAKIDRWTSVDKAALGAADQTRPYRWSASLKLPFELLHQLLGLPHASPEASSAPAYRIGLFKCADDSPRPHWGAWADIGEKLDFHQPDRFGALVLSGDAEAQSEPATLSQTDSTR